MQVSCYHQFSFKRLFHFFPKTSHLENQWGIALRALFVESLGFNLEPFYITTTFTFPSLFVPDIFGTTLDSPTGWCFVWLGQRRAALGAFLFVGHGDNDTTNNIKIVDMSEIRAKLVLSLIFIFRILLTIKEIASETRNQPIKFPVGIPK